MLLFWGILTLVSFCLIMILITCIYFDLRKVDHQDNNKVKLACIVYLVIFVILSTALTYWYINK